MKTIRRLWSKLSGTFTGRSREQQLADELQSHIEMQTEDNLRAGVPPGEARRAASLKFGSVESAKESYRDQRGAPVVENILWDLRHAVRGLRRNPGFTAVAVITLALGIGANTAVFSIADAVLFRPLPYANADRLLVLRMLNNSGQSLGPVPHEYLQALDEHHRGFSETGRLYGSIDFDGEGLTGMIVSANCFQILGIHPVRGRVFDSTDEKQGLRAILTYGAWLRRFGGADDIVGRSIKVPGGSIDIVGVLPKGFVFPGTSPSGGTGEFFTTKQPRRPENVPDPIVRLEPGVSREQAQAEIQALVGPLAAQNSSAPNVVPVLKDIGSVLYPVGRPILKLLLAAAGLVLLIGCANLANMLLTRAKRRASENGVRAALGASRARLMRPAIFESLIVGLAGAGLAAVVTSVTFDALLRQVPAIAYGDAPVGVNLRVVLFAMVLGLVGGLLFAILPAWRASRLDALAMMRRGQGLGNGSSRRRFGSPMVAAQVAIAIVLVFGAAIAGRAFLSMLRIPLGFTPENVVAIRVTSPFFAGGRAFYTGAVETLARRSDVISAGAVGFLPFTFSGMSGERLRVPENGNLTMGHFVLPGYFETAGIHLLRGRLPDWNDVRSHNVAVASESFARTVFRGRDPLEATLISEDGHQVGVIGVVADVRWSMKSGPVSGLYVVPGDTARGLTLVVRTRSRNPALLAEIKREIGGLAPGVSITASWWSDWIAKLTEFRNPRFQTIVLGSFAALALGLTGLGIYGIVAFMVAIRTREMGIRMAIGAAPRTLVFFTIQQAFAPVMVGLLAGLIGTYWLSRLAQAQLYKIEAHDPVTLAVAAATVVAAAFVAAYIPARHVSRIDPVVALRHE